MDLGVLAEAVELSKAREPFALATVVWRRGPSSGQVGSKAIIGADGSIRGWLGGACAQPTVVREALQAMEDGRPRLLFLGSPDDLHGRPTEGMITVPMACESDGAMEVYVEPFAPKPNVVVVGRSPAVSTLAALAGAIGWDAVVVDTPELDGLAIGASTAIVVATQGHYDDLALEAALGTEAGYVGLVASAKRAASTLSILRDRGLGEEQLYRVVAPAGLDLGSVENAEIGVAVLAELVARRAAGEFAASTAVAEHVDADAIDPVCGMTVDRRTARYRSTVDGVDVFFCGAGCKAAFDADNH